MKKLIPFVLIIALAFSCGKSAKGNMIVKGEISGLKKGTLYLQKLIDTTLITVDSIQLFGKNSFELSDNVSSPEVYYLTYNGGPESKKILFFGEAGAISINDNIEEFGFKPVISGSKSQEILNKFNETNQKFKLQRLDFIKKDIEARAINNDLAVDSLEKAYKNFVRKRFLYTTNFAIANKDSEVAPYIAISELFDANLYLLDTVNNSLTDKVKSSTYGKHLQRYIDDIKASDKK